MKHNIFTLIVIFISVFNLSANNLSYDNSLDSFTLDSEKVMNLEDSAIAFDKLNFLNRLYRNRYGYYFEHAFHALAFQLSSLNRGALAIGSTYQMQFCYNNEIKTKKDIYRVLTNNNDFMLEAIRSKDNKFNLGILFSSSFHYRIQDAQYNPLIGVQLRLSPFSNISYSIMPIAGVSAEIADFYYGYSYKMSDLYSGYSLHNFGMSIRLSEAIHALDSK